MYQRNLSYTNASTIDTKFGLDKSCTNAVKIAAMRNGKSNHDQEKRAEKHAAKHAAKHDASAPKHRGGNHKGGNSFVHDAAEPLDAISSNSPTIAKHCLKRAPMPTMFESILWPNVTDSELDDSTGPAVCRLFEPDTVQSA